MGERKPNLFLQTFGVNDIRNVITAFAPADHRLTERMTLSPYTPGNTALAHELQTTVKAINLTLNRFNPVVDNNLDFLRVNATNVPAWHIDALSRNNWDAVASLLQSVHKLEQLTITNWNVQSRDYDCTFLDDVLQKHSTSLTSIEVHFPNGFDKNTNTHVLYRLLASPLKRSDLRRLHTLRLAEDDRVNAIIPKLLTATPCLSRLSVLDVGWVLAVPVVKDTTETYWFHTFWSTVSNNMPELQRLHLGIRLEEMEYKRILNLLLRVVPPEHRVPPVSLEIESDEMRPVKRMRSETDVHPAIFLTGLPSEPVSSSPECAAKTMLVLYMDVFSDVSVRDLLARSLSTLPQFAITRVNILSKQIDPDSKRGYKPAVHHTAPLGILQGLATSQRKVEAKIFYDSEKAHDEIILTNLSRMIYRERSSLTPETPDDPSKTSKR